MNQLGDMLFSLPVLAAARAKWPDARLVSLARPEFEALLMASGFVDEVIVKWQNPLRLEWFPFLYGFLLDLQHLNSDYGQDNQWLDIHYPPIIAQQLKSKK